MELSLIMRIFPIHDDLFDIIQSTNQDINIMWKFISNVSNRNEYNSKATEIHGENTQNKKRINTKKSTKHNLQRKRQKTVDYREKSFDDFRLMIVDPPQTLESEKYNVLSSSFGISIVNKSNEFISKMVLTRL